MHGWSGQGFLTAFFCAVSVTVISFGEETLKFMKRVFFNETYYGRCRKLPGYPCQILALLWAFSFYP